MAASPKKAKMEQEFPTDWDVDSYRTEYESEEHWQLRRKFIEVHKNKFPEDRLVCLAAVFTNMEFMGCKYPAETMRLVAELGKEVVKEYRASRVNSLKRTFMAASDAAEARVKGRRNAQQQPSQQQHNDKPGCSRHVANSYSNFYQSNYNNSRQGNGERCEVPPKRPAYDQQNNLFAGLKFGKFVLFLSGGRNCIRTSAQRCNMEIDEKEVNMGAKKKVEIYLNGRAIASACEENLKASKAQAFSNTIDLLRKNCYSIKDTIKINKNNNQVVCGVSKQESDSLEDKKLDASNIGYKMMKTMGWRGGGLGSKTQGREEPVGYLLKNNRAGLGNVACRLDRSYFTQMLKNYVDSEDIRELQFESTFTKDDRAMLHKIAGKFNLKSNSYGKDESRRLVISKKTITNEQILTEILIKKNPSFADKYSVQVPESKQRFYPEHTTILDYDVLGLKKN